MTPETITRTESHDLMQVIRLRARVARTEIDAVAASRKADAEAQLSRVFEQDDLLWKEIAAHAQATVASADAQIAALCDSHNIPKQFRPSLRCYFAGRGENGDPRRRTELRLLAAAKIDADRKRAFNAIEAWTADRMTILLGGLLTTDAARTFLAELPQPEHLLPHIEIARLLEAGEARA